MHNDSVKLKVDLKEAYILFKLMGINSFIGYTNPFISTSPGDLKNELIRAKNNLLLEGILIEREGRIGIEPLAFSILQACKLSQNISWLHLEKKGEVRDSYFYISSRQVIEVVEEMHKGSAAIEFALTGDHEDFFCEIEQALNVPLVEKADHFNGKMNQGTYIHLLDSYDKISFEELVSYIDTHEKLSEKVTVNFLESLINSSAIGQLVFINRDLGVLDGVRFVLSKNHNWVLNVNRENNQELLIQSVLGNDLMKKVYETYIESFAKTKRIVD
ncbi:hypothetical protein J7E38_16615 [Bacillus sp. ISL-35]|uniref:hypothetical protein n=1 Tax=Bacillus sp. ISL-35 TaxID=2819122 RepID=UPI001BE58397|nr:hypothetical protein [Bacillus sp. ISL-35]MBT2680634.1 hypothetical protein [Bacillus sp. ISL-35]MBT2702735.1 hypothetical protein [Chryseobacterium sp. ISL-80]